MSTEQARKWQSTHPTYNEQQKQVTVKVHKQRWISRGEKALYSLVTSILVATAVFIVSFSANVDSLNRDVQKLQNNIKEQQIHNENLEYKVKELSNPNRILNIAKENGLKIQNAQVKQVSSVR